MNVKNLTADDILAISLDRPERLFTVDHLVDEIRALRAIWHPDRCKDPKATITFQRIQELQKLAEKRIAENTWDGPAKLTFRAKSSGSVFNFKYRRVISTSERCM